MDYKIYSIKNRPSRTSNTFFENFMYIYLTVKIVAGSQNVYESFRNFDSTLNIIKSLKMDLN